MTITSIFDGDEQRLQDAAYAELKALASRLLRGERSGHTLNTTALVHEAWLRLGGENHAEARDRFLVAGARAMRRVLVDHERARRRLKRGGGVHGLRWDDAFGVEGQRDIVDVLALEEALEALAAESSRQARVVELRFHGGVAHPDIARILDVSERTVERDWVLAKTFLRRRLEASE